MLETIRRLKERIEELELLVDSDPSRVYLSRPYTMPNMQETSPGLLPQMGFEGSPPIALLVRVPLVLFSSYSNHLQGTHPGCDHQSVNILAHPPQ
jgi:hypothetical protein